MSTGVVCSSVQNQAGLRIHIVQYQPTTRSIEDRFSVTLGTQIPPRLILGIYDGHGGAATAEHISKILPAALLTLPPEHHAQVFREIDDTMVKKFAHDHSIFRSKSPDWVRHAQIVKSGSTALILDINVSTLTASFANAGDCRAVLFTPSKSQDQKLVQTMDLNAKCASEQARLSHEHPDEDALIVGGRLFGRLMSTRGFGDACYKLPHGLVGNWSHRRYVKALSAVEDQQKITMSAQYQSLFYMYRTPPYVTAVPEVGTMDIKENSSVIMATDGLWDCISSELAVEAVRRGLEEGAENLAEYLLQALMATKKPGDDVTIMVIQPSRNITRPRIP